MSRYSVPLEAGELCGPRQEGRTLYFLGGTTEPRSSSIGYVLWGVWEEKS